jgi:hypothetical protein
MNGQKQRIYSPGPPHSHDLLNKIKSLNPLTTGAQSHLYACVPEANLEIMQKDERQEPVYLVFP